jgi:hypothetical protein
MTKNDEYLEIVAHRNTITDEIEACSPADAESWSIFYKSSTGSFSLRLGTCPVEGDPAEMINAAINDFPMLFYRLQGVWLYGDGSTFETVRGTPAELIHNIYDFILDEAPNGNINYVIPALDRLKSSLVEADQLCEGLRDEPIRLYAIDLPDVGNARQWMVHATSEKDALNIYADCVLDGYIPTRFTDGPETSVSIICLEPPVSSPRLITWDQFPETYRKAGEIPVVKHALANGYELEKSRPTEPETEAPGF